MAGMILLLVMLLLQTNVATATSTLATAAEALAVGSWTSITPTNKTSMQADIVTSYGWSASYDVVRRQINFVGSDHGVGYDHILWDDATNAYVAGTALPSIPFSTLFVGHAFDGNTENPTNGDVYYRVRNDTLGGGNPEIYKKTATSTSWTALADLTLSPDEGPSCCTSIAYFPEMSALILVTPTGRVYKCIDPCTSTGNWSLIQNLGESFGTNTFMEYSTVKQVVIFGSDTNSHLYKMTSAGTITQMGNIPVSLYDGGGYNGHVTADPVSGTFIVLTTGTKTCHTYNVTTDTWGTCTDPPAGMTGSVVAVAIPHYGVIAYLMCGTSDCQSAGNIYIYKHTTSDFATNDFTIRCSHPDVLLCNGFESSGEITQNTYLYPDASSNFKGSLDTAQKGSGSSSLMFTLTAGYGQANIAGYWRSADWGTTFSQNSHFYAQYRMRFSSAMLTNLTQWNSTWKTAILHYGGQTCGGIELTNKIRSSSNWFIESYTDCGAQGFYLDTGPTIYLQQGESPTGTGTGYWCPYPATPGPPGTGDCYFVAADTWYTVYWDVTIGTWGSGNSTVKMYMSDGGGAYQTVVNLPNITLSSNGTASEGYNRIDLLPYMTALSASADTTAYIWYDDVIVSSSPIAAPGTGVGGGDVTPPAAPSGVYVTHALRGRP